MSPENQATHDFGGKTAFITGASSGIGRAAALAFARAGANVAIADVQKDQAAQVGREIEAMGRKCLVLECDVSNEEQVKRAVSRTIETFGRLDVAFNDAGIEGARAPTEDCAESNWNRVIDVNLKGAWLCMKYQLPQMKLQGSGSIVNCASIAGLVGFAGIPAYVASKHGLVGLTKTAALECARTGVRVNAVCPGVIDTPMIDRFTQGDAGAAQALSQGEPVGRLGRPEEIADAVLWLASERASFVTGVALAVDGGWVAQ